VALQTLLPEFERRGATLLTLSPQLAHYARAWVAEDGITFPVVQDLGLAVARSYGLTFRFPDDLIELYRTGLKVDLARFNGDESWELPMPATFVIDTSGTIVYASSNPDYTVRPEPEEVLAAVP
jgi:peroxiredoxin